MHQLGMARSANSTSLICSFIIGVYVLLYTFAQCETYYIKSTSDQACLSDADPCYTLSEFARNFTSSANNGKNVTLMFLAGNHSLNLDLTFMNLHTVSMFASTNFNPKSMIFCDNDVSFAFVDLNEVHVNGLDFIGCASNRVESVNHFTLEDSSFIGREDNRGTALELLYVTARIMRSSFSNNKAQRRHRLRSCLFDVSLSAGGAIVSEGSHVTIEHSHFKRNSAQIGGAIFSKVLDDITIINSTFVKNEGTYYVNPGGWNPTAYCSLGGGAFHSDSISAISISDSYFEENTYMGKGLGGAVSIKTVSHIKTTYRENSVHLMNNQFIRNFAESGGALSVHISPGAYNVIPVTVTISASKFVNNTAATSGGALYLSNNKRYETTFVVTIIGSVFVNNKASHGGAVCAYALLSTNSDTTGTVTMMFSLFNTTFLSNVARESGGAMYTFGSQEVIFSLALNNSKFVNNSAESGGVISSNGTITIIMSVIVSMTQFNVNKAFVDGGIFQFTSAVVITMEIVQSKFVGNSAGGSGGISHSLGGNISIRGSHFHVNSASNQGGVIRAQGGSMTVKSTSFTGNLAKFGGVLWAESADIYYKTTIFHNNLAKIDGGVIHMEQSVAVIVRATFSENRADNNGGTMFIDGGKASIRKSVFSNNTAGSDGGVARSYLNDMIIKKCAFFGNEAVNEGGVLWNDQSSASIQKSSFESSKADAGGALYVDQGELVFNLTSFTRNRARAGAALWSKKCNAIYGQSVEVNDNYGNFSVILLLTSTAVLSDIVFANNVGSLLAQCSVLTIEGYSEMVNNVQIYQFKSVNRLYEGGALTAFQSTIHIAGSCELQNNYARRGGALHMIESKVRILGNTTVANNSAMEAGGGILLDHSELSCLNGGTISFWMNFGSEEGGGIMAITSSITISVENSNILTLNSNQAKKGGGIYFEVDSKLTILKSSANATHGDVVKFIHNSAEYGGAVYVSDDGMCSLTTVNQCPFQSLAMYGPMPVEMDSYDTRCLNTIHFFNNTAQQSGESLFGGLLDRCTVSIFAEPNINNVNTDYSFSNGTIVTDGHEYLKVISNIEDEHISSYPVRVCFCREGQGIPDCSYQPEPVQIYRGQQRNILISLSVVDQIDNPLEEATIYSHFGSGNFLCQNHIQSMDGSCTKLEFSVESSNDTEELILSIGDGPCEDTPQSQGRITIEYLCSRCPLGFEEDATTEACHCVCDSKLFPFFTNCSGDVLIRDKNVWITSINTNNNLTDYEYLIHPYCPHNYCHSSSAVVEVNLNVLNGADSQCANNRSGLLCGECEAGFTLSLGSSRCIRCPEHWPVVLSGIILGSILGGIILIVLLLFFNLTVAVGSLNGIVLYANIVAANRSIFLPFSTPNFVTVVVSWMNLEIGFDVCFFKGMDTFWKTLLQLAFPVYLIILVALVIIISEHSTKFAQLIGRRNPVATFSTLILLSYSKFLSNIVASMSFAVLKYQGNISRVVWLPDASVGYLKGKHVVLFIVALFILLAGVAYTVILLCWQWLLRYQNWKVLSWMKYQKLCHFVEPYHAPFTVEHRYWTGLLLLVRVLLYVIAAFNVNGDPHLPLLAIVVTVGSLLLIKGILVAQIYKTRSVDALEAVMYFNIVAFSALTWYFIDTGKSQTVISHISVTVTLVLFLTVVACHVFKYTCLSSLIKNSQLYVAIESRVLRKGTKQATRQQPKGPSRAIPLSCTTEPTCTVVEIHSSQIINVTD